MAEEFEGEVFFLGVSNNDTVEAGKEYARSFDVPYALAHAPEVWALFDNPHRPTTLLIDAEGKVVDQIIGPVDYEDGRKRIRKLL